MSGWVSFDDDGDVVGKAPAPPASSKTREDSGVGLVVEAGAGVSGSWVKFEQSPSPSTPTSTGHRVVEAQRPMISQHTGGSVHSSADVMSQASDDHHSAIASSVISSRGSFSGSHDNISSSREYMPLESSSSSPKPGNVTSNSEGWVKFGDSRKVVSSTPLKSVVPEKGIKVNGSLENSRVSSPAPVNWVQFEDDHDVTLSSTSSRPSPVLSSCDNSLTHESPLEDLSARSNSRPLEIPNKLNQNVIPGHMQVEKLKQKDVKSGINLNSSRTVTASSTPIHMSDHANDLEVSMFSEVATETKYDTATPGNPFKADILTLKQLEKQKAMVEQVRGTVSPFNPFLNMGGLELASTPVKSNSQSIWTTFDETDGASANTQIVSSSPGNPFAGMAVASTVHNRSYIPATFNPQQQAHGQVIFAAAAAAQQSAAASQQSVAASQPVKQVMAVQPLMQSSGVQPGDQRTAAILSPNAYASQPISPIGMKPNQWQQQQQQFFPSTSSPQSGYSSARLNIPPGKQTLAALVSPTTTSTTVGSDMPDSGKLPFNTQTSIKSNLSSPRSDKLFQDQYPREQMDLSEGWPLKFRVPDKKRIAGSRSWQPIYVRLSEGNILQLFHDRTRKEPFRELPLQSNYEIGHPHLQQYDPKGKIHTIKLLYMSYKEKRKVSAKSMYDKEAHLEELMKLGSLDFKVYQSFVFTINDALMKLTLYQDRGAHYQQDVIKVVVSDECRCLVNGNGDVVRQSISVGLNVLSFLSGSPDCAIGVNDVQVKGLDVVARQHIIPNKTSDWIKMHDVELHKCANKNVFVDSRMIEFQPLNACRFRLMQFHIQPSEEEDLPLQVRAALSGEGTHMELRVDLLVPACTGKRNLSHYLCENILVHIPVPDHWISYFRKPKRMGQSSIHAVIKRPDLIKRGCLNPKLLEISVGTAKYEHAYRAVMWRIDRLPERTTGQTSTYILKCNLNLSSAREVSKTFSRNIEVEYHTPHTTASKTTVRSLAVSSEKSPEKRIRYMATYEYQVQIEDNYIRHSLVDDDDAPGRCLQQ